MNAAMVVLLRDLRPLIRRSMRESDLCDKLTAKYPAKACTVYLDDHKQSRPRLVRLQRLKWRTTTATADWRAEKDALIVLRQSKSDFGRLGR